VTAYQAGRRADARRAFEAAAAADTAAALPHVYLGRMAREDGDLPRATTELTTALQREPRNAAAQREMGSVQLVGGRPDLAVSFFKRALEYDKTDRLASGGMACALMQQGNPSVADRFFARAGSGPWDACRTMAPGAPLPGGVGGVGAPGVGAPAVGAPGTGAPLQGAPLPR
jgi:Tfp pilus assembly protein PilF